MNTSQADLGPLVSIIMNCYNGEAYLREALDSILAQTYSNWEVIFWDNCSTDSSAEIARSYDSRVRYFRGTQNVPLGEARCFAVAKAQGEYLCFLDTDDLWLPTKLEEQITQLSNRVYNFCYAGIEEITEPGDHLRIILPRYPSGDMFPDLLAQFDINIVTPMIRLAKLREYGIEFDPNIHGAEEYNLFMRLAAKEPIIILDKVLGKYRVRERSLSNQIIDRWAGERYYTLDQIAKENPGIESKYPRAFKLARARGAYYEARSHMTRRNSRSARASLRPHRFTNLMYLALYCSLFFPPSLWDYFHQDKVKRRALPKLLGFTR